MDNSKYDSDQIERLVDAAWLILDDMQKEGLCVSLSAKARLRIAYEPFRDPTFLAEDWMSFADAYSVDED